MRSVWAIFEYLSFWAICPLPKVKLGKQSLSNSPFGQRFEWAALPCPNCPNKFQFLLISHHFSFNFSQNQTILINSMSWFQNLLINHITYYSSNLHNSSLSANCSSIFIHLSSIHVKFSPFIINCFSIYKYSFFIRSHYCLINSYCLFYYRLFFIFANNS